MRAEYYFLFLLIAGCQSHSVFEKIGDGYYFIGSEKTADHYFDWFIARRACWRNVSNLVSVETSEELTALEDYIVSRGYPDGSTFATSGHNFYSQPPFSWEGSNKPVNFARWAPNSKVFVEKSYLSLELINSSLYMRRSYGLDDYFICEYRLSANQLWLYLDPTTRIGIVLVIGCLASLGLLILLHRWMPRRKPVQSPDDKESLI
ncbi:uncharacterized protein [Drosophila kikkawai]|uniref:C-type lectin domain-containing protein n=1 Tax=Drosophila kikkawai TaxID=30033 RepID=A0A6P4JFX1_DROKI|nr:uncharacterized protein LOC108082708 [Drosophila kikkawai]